jgi:conjugal transfer pilus assembly protein TraW
MITFIMATLITVGSFGTTYPIAEPDAMHEIEQKVSNIDQKKIARDLEQSFKTFTPKDIVKLQPAAKSFSYHPDLSFTLDHDIPRVDPNGKISGMLYPKGYKFNPVEYLQGDPPVLVIFNANSEKEMKWVKKYYQKKSNIMFCLSEGDWMKASKELGTQVFYLKAIMADKLNLKNTVSVVSRDANKKQMRVDVYAVR